MAQVKISELARRSGFPPSTLRYYEQVGLLDPPERTAAGYRTYDEAVLSRLSFIAGAKRMRIALEDISELIGLWAGGSCAPVQHRMLALLAARHAAVEDEISELRTFADQLGATRERLDAAGPSDPCGAGCGCDLGAPAPTQEAPIACTLGADDLPQRLSDWRAVTTVAIGRSATDTGVRLTFRPSPALASRLASLAAAETQCCAFFRMTLTVVSDALTLDVACPASARPVLDELFDT